MINYSSLHGPTLRRCERAAGSDLTLGKYSDFFRKTRKSGPIPSGRRKHQNKFHCFRCNINYATSLTAMIDHAEAHKKDDFVFVGKIKSGSFAGAYRPREHIFNNDTGKFFHGSDALLHEIKIPLSMKTDEKHIVCRKCDEYSVEFNDKMTFQMQAKRARKMKLHEKSCKKKKRDLKASTQWNATSSLTVYSAHHQMVQRRWIKYFMV